MEYSEWKKKVKAVSAIVDYSWDYWLTKLNYPKDINVCSLPQDIIDMIYERIDEAVEGYFTGPNALYERNGFCPGWNYKARHKIRRRLNE